MTEGRGRIHIVVISLRDSTCRVSTIKTHSNTPPAREQFTKPSVARSITYPHRNPQKPHKSNPDLTAHPTDTQKTRRSKLRARMTTNQTKKCMSGTNHCQTNAKQYITAHTNKPKDHPAPQPTTRKTTQSCKKYAQVACVMFTPVPRAYKIDTSRKNIRIAKGKSGA